MVETLERIKVTSDSFGRKVIHEPAKCEQCGKDFTRHIYVCRNGDVAGPSICDNCVTAAIEKEAKEQERQKAEEKFNEICPKLYRATDAERLPEKFLKAVTEWKFSPRGLGLVAKAGKGKTRSAFLLVRRMIESKRYVCAVTATRFAICSADQFSESERVRGEARKTLNWAKSADILFLDDIGKQRFTERAEVDFYDLLETRSGNMLPIIWTANAGGKDLLAMLSKDRGEPILRRLVEFSEIVSL